MNKEKLNIFYKELQKCNKCELHKLEVNSAKNGKLRGEGENSDIVFVAQNPSSYRKGAGVFLPGSRNNNLFIQMMEEINYDRDEYFVTNIVKCSCENNDDFDVDYVKACKSNFQKELSILKPKVVIAVGSYPARALEIEKFKTKKDFQNILYLAIDHPSYCLRGGITIDEYRKQFKYLWENLKGIK